MTKQTSYMKLPAYKQGRPTIEEPSVVKPVLLGRNLTLNTHAGDQSTGSKIFHFRRDPFEKWLGLREGKQPKVSTVVFLV